MKWILIIILIFVVMLIACSLSEQYKEKFDFYNNLKKFLNEFKINLTFKQDKILNFLQLTKSKKQFNLFILSYKNYLKTNKLDLTEIKILDQEEKKQLENIIKNIGQFDINNEINQIDLFLIDVEKALKQAEENRNKLCPMILKLSLLFSIAVAVLLI